MEIPGFLKGVLGRKGKEGEAVSTPDVVLAELPDTTPEEVKARREANMLKHKSAGNYTVLNELVISNRNHTGVALLAPVYVLATSLADGKSWDIAAYPTIDPQDGNNDDMLGHIRHDAESRITTAEALEIADEWIRDSSVWVPDRQKVPFHPDMADYYGGTLYHLRGN